MAGLSITDEELLDKIVAELELWDQQDINDNVHHNGCGNVCLHEMVVRLAFECGALKSQTKKQQEMILHLQKQLDSKTNERQHIEQGQTVQKSNQSQTEFNEADVVMTDEGFLRSVPDQRRVISMERTDVSSEMQQLHETASMFDMSSTVEINDTSDIIIRSGEQSPNCESRYAEKFEGIEQCNANSGTFVTEMEHQQQRRPIHDVHSDGMMARLASDSASLKIQMNQQLEMILKMQEQLQTLTEIQRRNPQAMLCEAQQLHQMQVDEESTIELGDSNPLIIDEMHPTNDRSPLGDSSQIEQHAESDTVRLSTEERSVKGGVISLPQLKVCFVRLKKVDANQIASNLKSPEASPKNPQSSGKKSKTHSCGECNKRFISKSQLTRHSRTHTGEKPYVCTDCGVDCTEASNLKKHQKIHSAEKPCVCPDCGAAFRYASQLRIHQIIHSGEKPYVCSDCGLAFNVASNLRSHRSIHSGEKPYECTDCGVCFRLYGNLKGHQRIHSDENPFFCDICKKSFRLKRELRLHMGIHSGKKCHKCDECKKEFLCKDNLKKHLRMHSK